MVVAQSLMKFPQKTLLADRTSVHYATFSSSQIDEALQFEKDNASHLLLDDGIEGAKRFVEGFGRHGTCKNIKVRDCTSFKELSDDMI